MTTATSPETRAHVEAIAGRLFVDRLPGLEVGDAEQAAQVMLGLLDEGEVTAVENFAVHAILALRRGEGWATRLVAQALLRILDPAPRVGRQVDRRGR